MNKEFDAIFEQISQIPLIDTHEHLIDESERLDCMKPFVSCDDWSTIFGMYTKFDLVSSGMTQKELDYISSQGRDPLEKWKIIEPYWELIKYTGYGQVMLHTINELYGVSELSEDTIPVLQEKYEQYRKKGFYQETLNRANIKCCLVNPPGSPFKKTDLPQLLHQDIDALGMIRMNIEQYNEDIIPEVTKLSDWLEIIDWWFDKYADKAVGVKIGIAYFRRLDFKKLDVELAAPIFSKKILNENLSETEEKTLQDYLFWYVVDLASKNGLPVKLHTGCQAMNNFMNMEDVMFNPSDCANLCRLSPDTKFIFFHISYPHYESMIALTKHYSNAVLDMCWAWTINPIASIDFLKKYIVTSPINKLMAFGGDDLYIENILGHAKLARKGIAMALSELIQEKWISEKDAIKIANRIMWKNAEEIYDI